MIACLKLGEMADCGSSSSAQPIRAAARRAAMRMAAEARLLSLFHSLYELNNDRVPVNMSRR